MSGYPMPGPGQHLTIEENGSYTLTDANGKLIRGVHVVDPWYLSPVGPVLATLGLIVGVIAVFMALIP